jgi:hypothetical protein
VIRTCLSTATEAFQWLWSLLLQGWRSAEPASRANTMVDDRKVGGCSLRVAYTPDGACTMPQSGKPLVLLMS